jgi:hypothetical protein
MWVPVRGHGGGVEVCDGEEQELGSGGGGEEQEQELGSGGGGEEQEQELGSGGGEEKELGSGDGDEGKELGSVPWQEME